MDPAPALANNNAAAGNPGLSARIPTQTSTPGNWHDLKLYLILVSVQSARVR